MVDLKEKSIVITGASMGLGLAIAQKCIDAGAYVTICSRHKDIFTAAEELQQRASKSGGSVLPFICDITNEKNVNLLAESVCDKYGGIDGLVCNAGVHGPKGLVHQIDWESWCSAVGINLIGTVLTCRLVIPHLIKKGSGKIIIVSGGGATKPMPNLSAYAASKAAVVRFAETLAQELAPYNIDVNSLAPGALKTRLVDDIVAAGPESVGAEFYEANLKVAAAKDDSRARAADLCASLLSDTSKRITGKLISAVWDPWEKFQNHSEQLEKSDVYTLRRVVPEDRNMNFD